MQLLRIFLDKQENKMCVRVPFLIARYVSAKEHMYS